ncbi:MAG TPA: SDR family NAD(P)-dependent oxidoreductase [Caulobacterales bacterium]|nr:SDR family NAD(P)-dependent oxidoreductase [Caulobacterales bacterium]
MNSLEGRIAVVTGAARGIGRAIAEGLAAEGAAVVVTDRDEGALTEVGQVIGAIGGRVAAYGLDVTNAQACADLAKTVSNRFGAASILVNNAGIIFPGRIDDANAPTNWARTIDVNINGAFNMARAFHAQLKATKGAVINLASIRSFVAAGNAAAYATSKGAIMQFTRALAVEWGGDGIRVNAIAPGFIETALVPDAEKTPAREAAIMARTPLKRIGEPKDIAGAAVFLASDAAAFVTGAILPVDGGYLAG